MTVVHVEWMRGHRNLNDFMRRADLGIEFIGVREVIKITYDEGEEVTPERVLAAIGTMQDQMEQEGTEWEIVAPKVLSICPMNPESDSPPSPPPSSPPSE